MGAVRFVGEEDYDPVSKTLSKTLQKSHGGKSQSWGMFPWQLRSKCYPGGFNRLKNRQI